MFAPTDRYRLFAKVLYPPLVAARATLEKCYCPENGRVALEPVLMLGVSLLQFLDGVPDRQAVEMLRYHAGWNFALNRQFGRPDIPSHQLGPFSGPTGRAPAKCPGFHDDIGRLGGSGFGLTPKSPAPGLHPDVRAGSQDEPAGLRAGEFAAGPQ